MSSCFSPNTEQKYLLNVAGVFSSSLVLEQLQPLQDLSLCQNFVWPHDAATSPPSTAGSSCQEAPFITSPLIDVLLVAPSPLHHDYGFLPFPFITQQERMGFGQTISLTRAPCGIQPRKGLQGSLPLPSTHGGLQGKGSPGDASPHSVQVGWQGHPKQ